MQSPRAPDRLLSRGATAWFATALLGQAAFIAFIAVFFGGAIASGNLAAVNAKPHITGYAPGDPLGNLQFLGHALLGGLVTLAGLWQLVPALRRRWPAVHRWNGRLFLTIALVVTLTGFSLVWLRGSRLGLGSDVSISLNGLLIVAFALLAWRSARRRDFASHRRHALRAWLLVNGVWFLRIGIMLAGLVLARWASPSTTRARPSSGSASPAGCCRCWCWSCTSAPNARIAGGGRSRWPACSACSPC